MTSRIGKPIIIADYDPAWPLRFERERDEILRVCGAEAFVRIEHMGSTSVPGLAAKPIIDMMPGLRSLDGAPPLIPLLAGIGYEYVPAYERPSAIDEGMPFRRYFRKDLDGERAFQLHMVEAGSDFWVDHLRFRNELRAFPSQASAYERLKRALARRYNASLSETSEINTGYADHKSDFVRSVLDAAAKRIAASRPIRIVPYDPAWPGIFARERDIIAGVAGDAAAAIEHVGSTAVPGMATKPCVDIALGVRDMDAGAALTAPLAAAGYLPRPEDEPLDDWITLYKRMDGIKVANLHIVPHGGPRWRAYLLFRDYLRAHPDAAAAYAGLKRELAAEFGSDRKGYPEAKSDFVRSILETVGREIP
jgi:GrpB-like predicted nucleotidyltransferase (UPF0157 family)